MKGNRTALEELSKKAFNSEKLLAVVNELLRTDELVSVKDISDATGFAVSTVYGELNLLTDLSVLQRIIPDRTVLYQRLESPFWAWCEILIASAPVAQPQTVGP
jgi:hypothetical protein